MLTVMRTMMVTTVDPLVEQAAERLAHLLSAQWKHVYGTLPRAVAGAMSADDSANVARTVPHPGNLMRPR